MPKYTLRLPSIAALICIVAAAGLALFEKDGWGWFLVIALLLA